MTSGRVVAIWLAPKAASKPRRVPSAKALKARGLAGDRYGAKAGTYSKRDNPSRHLTLIESEALDAAAKDYGVRFAGGDHRRNVVTRGVALNHLVGRRFRIGRLRLRGIRLCEPCGHMERLSKRPRAEKALIHRGGLRCQILNTATIRTGDRIL